MSKRILAFILAAFLLIVLLPVQAVAQEVEPEEPDSSSYLNMYGATLYSNGTTGKLKITYKVVATDYMSTIGVFKISVRNANGTVYQTIWGSTSNGLLATNEWCRIGEYTLNLVSGNSYYCKVTVIAGNSSGADTRTITTALVTCP